MVLIDWFILLSQTFKTLSIPAGELKFWKKVHPPPCIMCHVSHVTCQVSSVKCHSSFTDCPTKIGQLWSHSNSKYYLKPDIFIEKCWSCLFSLSFKIDIYFLLNLCLENIMNKHITTVVAYLNKFSSEQEHRLVYFVRKKQLWVMKN